MVKVIGAGASMALMLGCLQTDELSILGASEGPLVLTLRTGKQGRGNDTAALDDESGGTPRHVYRASDMLLASCARLDDAGAIVGENCDDGFVVFGPYAAIAGSADVRVSFDVESNDELLVSSDVVSSMGERRHGGLENKTVRPQVKRSLRYRARLAQGGEAVEARVFVRRGEDVKFKILNFEIAVR